VEQFSNRIKIKQDKTSSLFALNLETPQVPQLKYAAAVKIFEVHESRMV
jgi:hypothetical protein